jgi:hypothetical protein
MLEDYGVPPQAKENERKDPRWNIPVPVEVHGTQSDGTEFTEDGITADASVSGMCILVTANVRRGSQLRVKAPEESFEGLATVTDVDSLGPSMNRVRVRFTGGKKFTRTAAAKKYVYDPESGQWIGYLLEGTYYNSKHEPFGRLEGAKIISLESGQLLFVLRWDRVYDPHAKCVGHLI